MSRVSGFVNKIFDKEITSKKNGKKYTTYSVKLQDPSTGEEMEPFFQFGFDRPAFAEGDYVTFEVTESKFGPEFVKGSGSKPSNPPARPKTAPAKTGKAGNAGGVKQTTISWQGAQLRASDLMAILMEYDGVVYTTTKGKAKQAARFQELVAIYDKLVVKLYLDALDPSRILDTVSDWSLTDTDAKGDLPADSDEETPSTDDIDPEEDVFQDEEGESNGSF